MSLYLVTGVAVVRLDNFDREAMLWLHEVRDSLLYALNHLYTLRQCVDLIESFHVICSHCLHKGWPQRGAGA